MRVRWVKSRWHAISVLCSQHTVLPTQTTGSGLVVRLAEQINAIDAEITDVDAKITDLFRQHDSADILLSMPGFGPVLAATFLANIGGNLEAFDSVDRLASVAGLAPVPRDSGRISGNLWLGPQVEVQCLCEFRVREWTQEEIHESWHADTPPSRSSQKSGRARRCSTTDTRWSRSSRSSRSPRRPGTAG